MPAMNFQPGDRALIKKVHGFKLIPELICWWTNSQFSHIEAIIDDEGTAVDATWPRVRLHNISDYLNGNYRVVVIRPRRPFPSFPEKLLLNWIDTLLSMVDRRYDLKSFIGFLCNKRVENSQAVTCAESVLLADKSVGFLTGHDGWYITPQSYWDFTIAGAFEVVYDNLK